MPRDSLDIAVVGAGVAGLAVAIQLTRDGHRISVFERFETSRPVGSGLMIQPTGLAALERLGLREELERRGRRIDSLQGLTVRGRTVFDIAYADLDPSLHALGVHRAALHGVLWDAFAGCGATIETGRAIAATEPVAGGRLALHDEAGRRLGPFDLVIDASGSHSPLRRQVTSARARPFAYGAVWTTAGDIGLGPSSLTQRYVAARIMVGYLPIGTVNGSGPPLAALFWSLKPSDHGAWREGFKAWLEEVARLWPALEPLLGRLDGPDGFTLASYSHFMSPRFSAGPLVLIGDAAHSTSPQLGQGANHGLLDACALADALRDHRDIPQALAAYERRRRRQIRFYQMASGLLTGFFQSDSAALAWARDAGFHRISTIPYMRREMVRTLAGLKTGLFGSAGADHIAGNRLSGP